MSKRAKRRIVSIATGLVGLFLYIPFAGKSWAIYAPICGGYTVLVLGLLWSDGKWVHYIESGSRTNRELIQGHICFLLLLVLWIWLCRYSRPWLPDWMSNLGPDELTPYLIFSGLGIVAIWWGEQSWLSRVPKKDAIGSSVRL
jgi:hypothetical protein